LRAAYVVVLQDKCNVVPVLGLPPGSGGGTFGEQKTSEARYIHFDRALVAADTGRQGPHLDISGRVSCATQIGSTQSVAFLEPDGSFRGGAIQVGQELKLDDSPAFAPIGPPAPDVVAVRLEFRIEQGML
jgi:hypothetical protein